MRIARPRPRPRRGAALILRPAVAVAVSLAFVAAGEDGRARVTFRLPEDPDRYRFLDVSVEPADGNPGHSGRSVLRGALRET